MKSLNYLFLILTLIFVVACNSTKELKEEIKKEETNSTIETVTSKVFIKEKSMLEKELENYLNAMQTFNTDVIMEMTYPKLFSAIDPDIFRQYIAAMINSTDIQMTAFTTKVNKISTIKSFSNGTEFAQVDYNSTITLQFINPNLYASREQMNYLYDVQIHKYGVKNVFMDPNKRILKVTKPEKLLAIKEQDTQWKFVGDNPRYRKYFPSFMPIEILQNLE